MLNRVNVINTKGVHLPLAFQDPTNGVLVTDVQGLEPVSSTMVSSSLATMDGEQFQSSRRDKRNIVLKMSLDPSYSSVAELRRVLYGHLMPKEPVTLRFFIDDSPVPYIDIKGRVESFVAPFFVQEPEATVSVLCHDPDFYWPGAPVVINGSTVANTTETLIDYEGTIEAGLIFRLNLNRALSSFYIDFRSQGISTKRFTYSGDMASGDVIEISTNPGSKWAYRRRNGATSSRLDSVAISSVWPELIPGQNWVRVYAEGTAIPFTIDYRAKYGGL